MKGKLLLCIFVINIMAFSLFAQEQEYVIKNGDTLSSLLKDYYTPSQILDISKKIKGRVEKFYLKANIEADYLMPNFLYKRLAYSVGSHRA